MSAAFSAIPRVRKLVCPDTIEGMIDEPHWRLRDTPLEMLGGARGARLMAPLAVAIALSGAFPRDPSPSAATLQSRRSSMASRETARQDARFTDTRASAQFRSLPNLYHFRRARSESRSEPSAPKNDEAYRQ
jgi:hypothetical protein